jgi:hypothetical protein
MTAWEFSNGRVVGRTHVAAWGFSNGRVVGRAHVAACGFRNGHEAGRTHVAAWEFSNGMTAINPDFSATCMLLSTSSKSQKDVVYFFCGKSMLLVAILPITHDATNIRDMVAKLLPSVSLGYVTMPMEIVCRTVIDIDIVAFITINGIGE